MPASQESAVVSVESASDYILFKQNSRGMRRRRIFIYTSAASRGAVSRLRGGVRVAQGPVAWRRIARATRSTNAASSGRCPLRQRPHSSRISVRHPAFPGRGLRASSKHARDAGSRQPHAQVSSYVSYVSAIARCKSARARALPYATALRRGGAGASCVMDPKGERDAASTRVACLSAHRRDLVGETSLKVRSLHEDSMARFCDDIAQLGFGGAVTDSQDAVPGFRVGVRVRC